ncbi:antimicrobial peptide damicornin-like [Pocillopora verrucosa]|uniref:aurelin-like n=1 Tax=Pocillopora damicornis TaxID=46731 RepID=UPI000F559965|nr:aurelin-like [Pocillopora damicornis]XP_058952753.1 antimicrobial peptide damicornin-like [Pocillopora verrucosa]
MGFYKIVLLFCLIVTLATRFPEAETRAISEEESLIEPDEAHLSDERRAVPGCHDEFSPTFCERFKKFCSAYGTNGFLMRTKCYFSCGCVRNI